MVKGDDGGINLENEIDTQYNKDSLPQDIGSDVSHKHSRRVQSHAHITYSDPSDSGIL